MPGERFFPASLRLIQFPLMDAQDSDKPYAYLGIIVANFVSYVNTFASIYLNPHRSGGG